jgi:hypothetical protein
MCNMVLVWLGDHVVLEGRHDRRTGHDRNVLSLTLQYKGYLNINTIC